MSHSPEQKALAIAIGKRDQAATQLQVLTKRVAALSEAEGKAIRSVAASKVRLDSEAANKVRTGTDDNGPIEAARTTFERAELSKTIANTEHEAGKRVLAEAESELEKLTNAVLDLSARVAVELDLQVQARAIDAAATLGTLLNEHRSLVRFARVSASHSGLQEPIEADSPRNPFTQKISELLAGSDAPTPFHNEQSMLDARL